jgi:hypothetical protein
MNICSKITFAGPLCPERREPAETGHVRLVSAQQEQSFANDYQAFVTSPLGQSDVVYVMLTGSGPIGRPDGSDPKAARRAGLI